MVDFVTIETKMRQNGTLEIFPRFLVVRSQDLMIRGHAFYAIWDHEKGCWSTDVQRVVDMIDDLIFEKYEQLKSAYDGRLAAMYMRDGDSKSIDKWNHYVSKQMYDNWKQIDDTIVFANDRYERDLYSSHRLPYNLEVGAIEAYDKLIGTLYSPEERKKFEWAIGSVVCGDAKWIQKFLVFVGDHGTGKSTVLKIIRWLFEGYGHRRSDPSYIATIDAKAIGSANASFALESLRDNPLVAIQDDTDLSRIEDNTRLNSIVSHEPLSVSIKYQSSFPMEFHAMLFLGTNKEVKITDSRSGLIRRLIDVKPTGNRVSAKEYRDLMKKIRFELGAIAKHCLDVYEADPYAYDGYVPTEMMRSTNITYSWLEENLDRIVEEDGISLASAWLSYKAYCDDADIQYRLNKQALKNELKGYFEEFLVDGTNKSGDRVYNYFKGFKIEKMGRKSQPSNPEPETKSSGWLVLDKTESLLDEVLTDMPAQYAAVGGDWDGKPQKSWDKVTTKLADLNTTKLHYVKLPPQHIFIDFDLRNEAGEKDAKLNLAAAEAFPRTYAEFSKGGGGLHLHYIYNGDVSILSAIYAPGIEVKVLKGGESLRRRLSYCNDIPVATISGGLPLKEAKPEVKNSKALANEKALRTTILRACRKEYAPHSTVSMISYIEKILNDAYNSGMKYDVSDMMPMVDNFASHSTNHSKECIKVVMDMKWKSDEVEDEAPEYDTIVFEDELVFYDVEVFPNLFIVVWKPQGKDPVIWINPTPEQCEWLMGLKLVGFNNRRYDNHIIYARAMGTSIAGLYNVSQKIIKSSSKVSTAFFRGAYDISYTDIYDYAKKKQSLKKWEIELGIDHVELGLDWDTPVPEDLWNKVAEYCVNDVLATEAVFNATQADFIAREILAELTGMTPNATTNTLTAKLIFGNERHPHGEFKYRDLSKPVKELDDDMLDYLAEIGMKVPFDDKSLLPYFEGYKYEDGKSYYRGFEVGEGGFVYAEPGIYENVALIDVESMHPNSAVDECLFGPRFTRIFRQLLQIRIFIKHGDFDSASRMFDGKLARYLQDEDMADQLSGALKIAINSVYGLTSAHFDNVFHDARNVDNIVAKRGALFMLDLKTEVEKRGFVVAHIKTDSIKIPNANNEIIDFCMEFAAKYGYKFEHEATYEKMCLVNNAVYVAKYATEEWCSAKYGYCPTKNHKKSGKWDATGTQFQVPYVFKTLFSHEPVTFRDMCETKSVQTAIYLDMGVEGEHNYKFVGKVGRFTPVLINGGALVSKRGDKYSAVTGTKGFQWVESGTLESFADPTILVDQTYYRRFVDDAIDAIAKYGDANWFLETESVA